MIAVSSPALMGVADPNPVGRPVIMPSVQFRNALDPARTPGLERRDTARRLNKFATNIGPAPGIADAVAEDAVPRNYRG